MRRRLVVFARAPVLGGVKRRLAHGIGAGAAVGFYRRNLAALLRRLACDSRWQTVLAVTPDRSAVAGRLWPGKVGRLAQGRGDLGLRMARALAARPAGPVCIVGADIPGIEARHVWRAFRALAAADVVLGPAEDGGYWLIGSRRRPLPRGLFANVRWSTAHALDDTLANLNRRRVALVDRLADVDDAEAYRRWNDRHRERSDAIRSG